MGQAELGRSCPRVLWKQWSFPVRLGGPTNSVPSAVAALPASVALPALHLHWWQPMPKLLGGTRDQVLNAQEGAYRGAYPPTHVLWDICGRWTLPFLVQALALWPHFISFHFVCVPWDTEAGSRLMPMLSNLMFIEAVWH